MDNAKETIGVYNVRTLPPDRERVLAGIGNRFPERVVELVQPCLLGIDQHHHTALENVQIFHGNMYHEPKDPMLRNKIQYTV